MNARYRFLTILVFSCAVITTACSKAMANVQTLRTTNCGVKWELIPAGQTIPANVAACSYTVTVPDYPLQGETKFKTSFKDRVIANVEINYEYVIVDALKFIAEAKYIGKANSDAQDETNSSSAYESAENTVIDKRIREATTSSLVNQDIVEFSQAEFEDSLLVAVNKELEDRGVRLNFLSFVPTPEEQTRLAIDMLTAMRVYEAKKLGELGQRIAIARAGATKVEVNLTPTGNSEEKKD